MDDGFGGCVITWEDQRNIASGADIYAQRLDHDGAPQWTVDGIPFSNADDFQQGPRIIRSDADGIVIAWSSLYENRDIYAQKCDLDGTMLWQIDGVPVCTSEGTQYDVQLAPDGNGGAVLAWTFQGETGGIYAQRIRAGGEMVANEPEPGHDDIEVLPGTLAARIHPNPFNPSTTISFDMAAPGHITVSIVDLKGRMVACFMDEFRGTGTHVVEWNGTSDDGRSQSSGTYLVRLQSGERNTTALLTLVR